jgi:hypothetical protein
MYIIINIQIVLTLPLLSAILFQIEINPNMIVAEISFDNNAVVCDLNYTGYFARIFNCKLTSLI